MYLATVLWHGVALVALSMVIGTLIVLALDGLRSWREGRR